MTRRWMVCAVLVAACGDDGGKAAADAAIDAPWSCPSQAGVVTLPPGQHVLFLNTEGVTLTDDGACDNSQTNCTPLLNGPTANVPPFYMGEATRASSIEAIRKATQTALAPYSVDVVTMRPTSGDYWMTVMGGNSMDIVGAANIGSVAPGVCDASNRNRISIVFDLGVMSPGLYATSILSDFGAMLGMAATATVGDCMCRESGCGFAAGCTFGMDVAVGTTHTCGRTTQNEVMILATELGCR